MSEYVPTTEDIVNTVLNVWCMAMAEDEAKQAVQVFFAAHDAEVAAKAWDEGYWQGINGHTGPGNPYRDSGAAEYRKAVQS